MGYSHFDKVSGQTGLGVGVKGSEIVVTDSSGNLYQAGTLVSATAVELNQYAVTVYLADANTAGSGYVTVPHAGTIAGLYAVNYAANTTTKTTLTAKIATVAVTAPAWEIAVTQAAGVTSNVVTTAANTITAGAVIEIASDGAGLPAMPATVTILITR